MSVSSATTLISPTLTKGVTPSANPGGAGGSTSTAHHPTNHRRPSVHGVKRRPSSHAAHGHHGNSNNRRSSEGEHGRRALAAGLAMHALDTTDAMVRKKKEKRPLAKNSRSDTHLPRLSRTPSHTSNTSDVSHTSHGGLTGRPRRNSHKKSEESVQLLKDNGEDGEEVEENEEGWEESVDQSQEQEKEEEEEDEQLEISPEKSKKGKSRIVNTQNQNQSSKMRRTVSDTTTEPHQQNQHGKKKTNGVGIGNGEAIIGNLKESPSEIVYSQSQTNPSALTQKTTGFAGTIQPTDPQLAAQLPSQDPHPIVTPHPIRRNTSAKSLIGPISMEPTTSNESQSRINKNKRQPSNERERGESKDRSGSVRPENSSRLRSTEGSGLPKTQEEGKKDKTSTSPSYPFPQMAGANDSGLNQQQQHNQEQQQETHQIEAGHIPENDRSASQEERQLSQRERQVSQPPPQSRSQTQPPNHAPNPSRTRQASQPHPQLRHRYSNSSLRSIQSLRAPPHPLNSPTGYRTHATTATSRPGSMFGSPTKDEKRQRVPSMHQPPVPQPQVSYELAKGKGWDETIPEGDIPRRTVSSQGVGSSRGSNRPQSSRKESISSMRSIFAPLTSTTTTSSMGSPSRSISGQGVRRKTALEAASEASKMSSTNDSVLYHNSLGHSSNIPETVYLISRFLPLNKNKTRRPKWEMNMRDSSSAQNTHNLNDEGQEEEEEVEEEGGMKIGLTNGDYRESHESLIRSIKNLGSGLNKPTSTQINGRNITGGNSSINKSYSTGYNLSSDNSNDGLANISIKTKDGQNLIVKKGLFTGKTPFEMSVQRCLTQRPGGGSGIGY